MSDKGLLKIAIRDFKDYSLKKKHYDNDELMLNAMAYNLSQCLEKLLKFKLLENGVKYPRSHSISELLNVFEENKIEYDEDIDLIEPAIREWAVQTRYNIEIVATIKLLERVEKICEELIKGVNDELNRIK